MPERTVTVGSPSTGVLHGHGVSPGSATGPVVRMADPLPEPATGPEPADRESELARIRPAMEVVAADLSARAGAADGETKAVLEATAMMAGDPGLSELAETAVREQGVPAPRAVWDAANTFRDLLADAGGYLGARASDVEDVRNRIVGQLLGLATPGIPNPGHPFILVAHDLAPADTATIDPTLVLAFVTAEGGPTSHTAILARSLGIPAVVSCPGILGVSDGTVVVVDGATGAVDTAPSERAVQEALARAARAATRDRRWTGRGGTADGHEVTLLANVGDPAGAVAAVADGAEGVGLFRTEFLFLDRTDEPSVSEQRGAYADVFAAFPDRKVVVRTLDAGADKPLPFLDQGEEANPALGVRGLRIGIRTPEVLDRQLEAIAAAAAQTSTDVWVMAPMVAVVGEAAFFAERARAAGLRTLGVMIEIPAAALAARQLLEVVDFVSIGTNDLCQYTLAADRMSSALAALNDPWQPTLLQLVAMTGQGGEALGKPVGVCGEAAADPALAPVLVGLGVTSLSMSARSIADVGAVLASVTLDGCRELAQLALSAPDAQTAREVVRRGLPVLADLGL
jgi:phosphoenolpyruvate-protein phosphotransferase (PTS system enzyme I)